jgi:hypothetical protein
MFHKNVLLIKNDNSLYLYKNNKNDFSNIKIDEPESIKLHFWDKKFYIVLEGEETYVKLLSIPKIELENIYDVVKTELKYNFNNIDDIIFTYKIYREYENKLELLVYCINSSKYEIIKRCSEIWDIKGINVIQFCLFNYVKSLVDIKKYIYIYLLNENLYLTGVSNNEPCCNLVMQSVDKFSSIQSIIDEFIIKYNKLGFGAVEGIYSLNIESKIYNLSENIKCRNLGEIKTAKLFNTCFR